MAIPDAPTWLRLNRAAGAMTDLLSVPMRDRARLLEEVTEDDRAHFFATSKCPIGSLERDEMLEEVSHCLRPQLMIAIQR